MSKNATDLFIQPCREFHSSESFWTSLLALGMIGGCIDDMPVYCFNCDKEQWAFSEAGRLKLKTPLTLQDVIVEGNVSVKAFPGASASVPGHLQNLKPDIMIVNETRVRIFEIKTMGASLHQIALYPQLEKYLNENGYHAELYLVVSRGHENVSDWNRLANTQANAGYQWKLLLWEDCLKRLSSHIIHLDSMLSHYANWFEYDKSDLSGTL